MRSGFKKLVISVYIKVVEALCIHIMYNSTSVELTKDSMHLGNKSHIMNVSMFDV